jgi:hypothetical protein
LEGVAGKRDDEEQSGEKREEKVIGKAGRPPEAVAGVDLSSGPLENVGPARGTENFNARIGRREIWPIPAAVRSAIGYTTSL